MQHYISDFSGSSMGAKIGALTAEKKQKAIGFPHHVILHGKTVWPLLFLLFMDFLV